uniref:Histone-lysine N-methyltransferase n=1 Tax=Strigamia maritima TaxID=126957 RepID=T1J0S7_STRMM
MMQEQKIRDFSVPCIQAVDTLRNKCSKEGIHFSLPKERKKSRSNVNGTGPDAEVYEVERIVNYAKDPMGDEWYLVKWVGWPEKNNSWEPIKNLVGAKDAISDFHMQKVVKLMKNKLLDGMALPDVDRFLQIICKRTAGNICSMMKESSFVKYKNGADRVKKLMLKASTSKKEEVMFKTVTNKWLKYQKVQQQLHEWEAKLNSVCTDKAKIIIENVVDFEGPPFEFTYVNDYKPSEGIIIPNDPPIGCDCTNCFDNRKKCCSHSFGIPFAYNRLKRINVNLGTPIYECNNKCKCPPTCLNRVVQHGRKIDLAIFRTANGCGWGVKTLEFIKADTFVMEYVGEVITNEEAEVRGQKYDAQGRTYLFDLDYDYSDGDCPFTVDATYYGNVSHFMNHSCEPNLVVYGVWINNLDPRFPRLAFFSYRDIRKGEELTFDYKMSEKADISQAKINGAAGNSVSRIQCKCGTASCRKFLC